MDIFEEILRELEYRSGKVVDLKDKSQIAILSEILDETDLALVKNEIIANLTEKGTTPRDSKDVEREKETDDKYVHTSNNVYIKQSDKERYEKNPNDPKIGKYNKDDETGTYKTDSDANTNIDRKTDSPANDAEQTGGEEGGEEEAEIQQGIEKTFGTPEDQAKVKDETESAESGDDLERYKDEAESAESGDDLERYKDEAEAAKKDDEK